MGLTFGNKISNGRLPPEEAIEVVHAQIDKGRNPFNDRAVGKPEVKIAGVVHGADVRGRISEIKSR